MVITDWKAILDVHSFCESEPFESTKAKMSLEEAIRRDFGAQSIGRFKEYNVEVSAPISDPEFKLGYAHYGLLHPKLGDESVIGLVYQVNMHQIKGVSAKRTDTFLAEIGTDQREVSMIFDLNPTTEKKRYLKMLFSYK